MSAEPCLTFEEWFIPVAGRDFKKPPRREVHFLKEQPLLLFARRGLLLPAWLIRFVRISSGQRKKVAVMQHESGESLVAESGLSNEIRVSLALAFGLIGALACHLENIRSWVRKQVAFCQRAVPVPLLVPRLRCRLQL